MKLAWREGEKSAAAERIGSGSELEGKWAASSMDKQIKSLTRPPENRKTGEDQTRSAAKLQIWAQGINECALSPHSYTNTYQGCVHDSAPATVPGAATSTADDHDNDVGSKMQIPAAATHPEGARRNPGTVHARKAASAHPLQPAIAAGNRLHRVTIHSADSRWPDGAPLPGTARSKMMAKSDHAVTENRVAGRSWTHKQIAA